MTTVLKIARFPAETGEVGTLGYTVFNSDGTVAQARTTAGIAALTGFTDAYVSLITLPGAGPYALIWDDGAGNYVADTLVAPSGGSGSDPWAVALPGSYTSGESGYILGNLIATLVPVVLQALTTSAAIQQINTGLVFVFTSDYAQSEGDIGFIIQQNQTIPKFAGYCYYNGAELTVTAATLTVWQDGNTPILNAVSMTVAANLCTYNWQTADTENGQGIYNYQVLAAVPGGTIGFNGKLRIS